MRASSGTAFADEAGKPRSSITAAIGIGDVHRQRLAPHLVNGCAERARERDVLGRRRRVRPPVRSPLGAPVDRLVHPMPKARDFPHRAASDLLDDLSRRATGRRGILEQPRAELRRAEDDRAAAEDPRRQGPCSDRVGGERHPSGDVVGIIPCSAIATRSRSRKNRWSSVGSRPVSSRWKYSVKLSLPIRSPQRSRPRTSTRSG